MCHNVRYARIPKIYILYSCVSFQNWVFVNNCSKCRSFQKGCNRAEPWNCSLQLADAGVRVRNSFLRFIRVAIVMPLAVEIVEFLIIHISTLIRVLKYSRFS